MKQKINHPVASRRGITVGAALAANDVLSRLKPLLQQRCKQRGIKHLKIKSRK